MHEESERDRALHATSNTPFTIISLTTDKKSIYFPESRRDPSVIKLPFAVSTTMIIINADSPERNLNAFSPHYSAIHNAQGTRTCKTVVLYINNKPSTPSDPRRYNSKITISSQLRRRRLDQDHEVSCRAIGCGSKKRCELRLERIHSTGAVRSTCGGDEAWSSRW